MGAALSNAFDSETTNDTTDPRALVEPAPQTSRIVSEWYAGNGVETLHVSTTDGHAHTVALYLLDWDNTGTVESITAQTASGTVVDTHEFSRFSGGVYAVYQVCGSMDFVVTSQSQTAVVNGIFFGPPAGVPSATNYLVDTSGGLSQAVADTDGSGKLTSLYVRNGDELLAVMRPAGGNTWTTRFVHGDGLGSVRVLTDESGTTVDSRGYE